MGDLNALAGSAFVALVLALTGFSLFLSGKLARGALVTDLMEKNDKLSSRIDRLADALEKRNAIDEQRLKWDQEHDERRGRGRQGSF